MLGVPLLDPADVQNGSGEVDLVPTEIHKLTHAETVAISDRTMVASR